jgi:hypothetical protein
MEASRDLPRPITVQMVEGRRGEFYGRRYCRRRPAAAFPYQAEGKIGPGNAMKSAFAFSSRRQSPFLKHWLNRRWNKANVGETGRPKSAPGSKYIGGFVTRLIASYRPVYAVVGIAVLK